MGPCRYVCRRGRYVVEHNLDIVKNFSTGGVRMEREKGPLCVIFHPKLYDMVLRAFSFQLCICFFWYEVAKLRDGDTTSKIGLRPTESIFHSRGIHPESLWYFFSFLFFSFLFFSVVTCNALKSSISVTFLDDGGRFVS